MTSYPKRKNIFRMICIGLLTLLSLSMLDALWVSVPSVAAAEQAKNPPTSGIAPSTNRSGKDTIILVHGFQINSGLSGNGSSIGVNCQEVWGTTIDYIKKSHSIDGRNRQWSRTADIQTVGYYGGDTNCNANLHDSRYTSRCKNYVPANEGTNNESLYHISCLFAWYLYLNYGQYPTWNVEIVAHSMGGLIVRNALYQVEHKKAPAHFPPTLGGISDVVTFGTPHLGMPDLLGATGYLACGGCEQATNMAIGGQFMNELTLYAQNPQAAKGTDWTLIGSKCDEYVSVYSASFMATANAVAYFDANKNGSCYDHGGYLGDTNDHADAFYHECQQCLSPPGAEGFAVLDWKKQNRAPRALHEMMHALWMRNR